MNYLIFLPHIELVIDLTVLFLHNFANCLGPSKQNNKRYIICNLSVTRTLIFRLMLLNQFISVLREKISISAEYETFRINTSEVFN